MEFVGEEKLSLTQQLHIRGLEDQILYHQHCLADVAYQLRISQTQILQANEVISDMRRRLEVVETAFNNQQPRDLFTSVDQRSFSAPVGIYDRGSTPSSLSPSMAIHCRQEEERNSPYRTKKESPEDVGRRVSYAGRLFGIVEETSPTSNNWQVRTEGDYRKSPFRDLSIENSVDDVLKLIIPQIQSLYYRSSVEKYISVLVSKSLGAQVYEMGLHSLGCFLPDDPLNLAIFLCRGLENSWYIRLNEKLCRMSSAKSLSEPENSDNFPRDVGNMESGETEGYLHTVKNVSFVNENGEYRLQCIVDSITVDIRINSKLDLCFVSFLEEVDRSIGSDHLFKKSLLLIKAWWKYEASGYNKITSPGLLLPNSALCIMICGIFSMHRESIQHPMHCLYYFLMDYSRFNWDCEAVTVHGFVRIDERHVQHDKGVISKDLTKKYEMMVNNSDLFKTNENGDNSIPLLHGLVDVERSGDDAQLLPEKANSSDQGSHHMHVYHPLDLSKNVIPQTIAASEMRDIALIFNYGAEMIAKVFTGNCTEANTSIMEMFGETCSRFASGNRPDSFHVPHVVSPLDRRLSVNSASSSVMDLGSDALSHERQSSVTSSMGDFVLHDTSEDR